MTSSERIAKLRKKVLKSEKRFLKGPSKNRFELLFVIQVMIDFIKGLFALRSIGPGVTIFGSAKFDEENIFYKQAYEIGSQLSNIGFAVLTGGGPGIMEAANKGAFLNNGKSVGVNILLADEQKENDFLHLWVTMKFFFVRKTVLIKHSYAFIIFPGGWGTLDELFEALTLVRTGKLQNFPVILFGKEYWSDLMNLFDKMIATGALPVSDLELVYTTDSVDECIDYIKKHSVNRFGLKRR